MSPTKKLQSKNKQQESEENPFEEDTASEECFKKGRKFCKTLDVADVDTNDNLYVAVRQNLHKVNRVSRISLSPFKRSNSDGDTGGVSQESSVGRFSVIKAFFDREMGSVRDDNKKLIGIHNCKVTVMGKLLQTLAFKRQTSCYNCPGKIV